MRTAVFKSYKRGYYTFTFEKGEDIVFEEVHPRVLNQFDLRNDKSLIDKTFKLSFVEVVDNTDEDFIIYRIESLKNT